MTEFAWHPSDENTLLVAGNYGSFACWQVSDRLTVNWSGRHCLVWAGGKNRMKTVTLDADNDDDIAVLMQSRAKTGTCTKKRILRECPNDHLLSLSL